MLWNCWRNLSCQSMTSAVCLASPRKALFITSFLNICILPPANTAKVAKWSTYIREEQWYQREAAPSSKRTREDDMFTGGSPVNTDRDPIHPVSPAPDQNAAAPAPGDRLSPATDRQAGGRNYQKLQGQEADKPGITTIQLITMNGARCDKYCVPWSGY